MAAMKMYPADLQLEEISDTTTGPLWETWEGI